MFSISIDVTKLDWFFCDEFMETLRETMGYPKGCGYIDAFMIGIIHDGIYCLVRGGKRKGKS